MSQKHLKPIYWGIFSVGGTLAALALAPLLLIMCLLLPFGVLGDAEQFYEQVTSFVGHPLVFVILAGLLFTLIWHGCHRFYYILHDMHLPAGNGVRLGFYAIAVVSLLATLYLGLLA